MYPGRPFYILCLAGIYVMFAIYGCSNKSNPVGPQDNGGLSLKATVTDENGNSLKDVRVHYVPILKTTTSSLGKPMPSTVIGFEIPEQKPVDLFTLRFGTRDTIEWLLKNETLQSGNYSAAINESKYTNGLYFYVLKYDSVVSEHLMLILNSDNELVNRTPLTTADSNGKFELPYKVLGIGQSFPRTAEDSPQVIGYTTITDSIYIYLTKEGFRDYKEKLKIDTAISSTKTFRMRTN